MPKTFLSPNRLGRKLAPFGFSLCRSCATTKEIGFFRPSTVERLYEQIRIQGQGKSGEAVYAVTAVSACRDWINDECIATVDEELMHLLETDKERHWTLLANADEAETWEFRLSEMADGACQKTTAAYGADLLSKLGPELDGFDACLQRVGDLKAILDSEYAFTQRADARELAAVDLWSIGKNDDWRLACHLLIRHSMSGDLVNEKFHESPKLRVLLYLMNQQVAAVRTAT